MAKTVYEAVNAMEKLAKTAENPLAACRKKKFESQPLPAHPQHAGEGGPKKEDS